MRKFAFRLEKILRLRREEEQVVLQQLGQARRRLRMAEAEEKRITREKADFLRRYRRLLTDSPPDPNRLSYCASYTQILERQLQKARAECAKFQEEVERLQEKVLAARRRRQVLEKLKERKFEQWQRDRQYAEVKELDEVGNSRWRDRECGNGL